MSAFLFIGGAALTAYAAYKKGALASLGIGAAAGDTILPNGQPAQMTAAEWLTFKTNTVNKYVSAHNQEISKRFRNEGPGITDIKTWLFASMDARQLQRTIDGKGRQIPDACQQMQGGPSALLVGSAKAGQVTGIAQQGLSTAGKLGANVTSGLLGNLTKSIPVIGTAIGVFTSILGAFTSAHSAAEDREFAIACGLTIAANAALAQVDSDFRSGKISSPQATQELETLIQNFVAEAAPSLTGGQNFNFQMGLGGSCNMLCFYSIALRCIADVREQVDY